MQDNANFDNDKDWIHPGTHGGRFSWEYGLTHQRNYHASAVVGKLRGLRYRYIRNRIAQDPLVAMNIELRHHKVECSSANEPMDSFTAFQLAAHVPATS